MNLHHLKCSLLCQLLFRHMDQGVQNSFTEVGPRVEKDLTYSSSNLDKNDFSQKCFCDSFNSTVLNIFIFHIAMYAPY